MKSLFAAMLLVGLGSALYALWPRAPEHQAPHVVATVSHFDADLEPIKRMNLIIQEKVEEGATLVRFPDGQWQWHRQCCLNLPKKETLVDQEFKTTAANLNSQVRNWIENHKVQAVNVYPDPEAPARTFFIIERILTDLEVPYWVLGKVDGEIEESAMANPKHVVIRLLETDGRS